METVRPDDLLAHVWTHVRAASLSSIETTSEAAPSLTSEQRHVSRTLLAHCEVLSPRVTQLIGASGTYPLSKVREKSVWTHVMSLCQPLLASAKTALSKYLPVQARHVPVPGISWH
eukprot:TRINITY_DN324_c0_g1_i1.p2 TRINITY_DN324_c0_g1~~TRINITY_DN324_c0_g1_i1.p2  ORF type:complete len:116 (-),score=6.10 TRINITY_DN324_c0_g1_i1:450-797(-)